MIRRLFWLVVGATAGIAGYRRVQALARRMNRPALTNTVRETTKFVRDVRTGMEDYETTRREGS